MDIIIKKKDIEKVVLALCKESRPLRRCVTLDEINKAKRTFPGNNKGRISFDYVLGIPIKLDFINCTEDGNLCYFSPLKYQRDNVVNVADILQNNGVKCHLAF